MSTACEWSKGEWFESSLWQTGCRQEFELTNDEGPTANGFKFCAYCGKPLVEVKTNEDEAES